MASPVHFNSSSSSFRATASLDNFNTPPQVDSKVKQMVSKLNASNFVFATPPRSKPKAAHSAPDESMSMTPLRLTLPSSVQRRRSAGLKFTPSQNLDNAPLSAIPTVKCSSAFPAASNPTASKTHSIAFRALRFIACLGVVLSVYFLAKRFVVFKQQL